MTMANMNEMKDEVHRIVGDVNRRVLEYTRLMDDRR